MCPAPTLVWLRGASMVCVPINHSCRPRCLSIIVGSGSLKKDLTESRAKLCVASYPCLTWRPYLWVKPPQSTASAAPRAPPQTEARLGSIHTKTMHSCSLCSESFRTHMCTTGLFHPRGSRRLSPSLQATEDDCWPRCVQP